MSLRFGLYVVLKVVGFDDGRTSGRVGRVLVLRGSGEVDVWAAEVTVYGVSVMVVKFLTSLNVISFVTVLVYDTLSAKALVYLLSKSGLQYILVLTNELSNTTFPSVKARYVVDCWLQPLTRKTFFYLNSMTKFGLSLILVVYLPVKFAGCFEGALMVWGGRVEMDV